MKTTTEQPSCKWNLHWLFILICTTLVSTSSYGQAGNAPMQQLPPFPGLFAIDGFLQRQGVNGDWLGATDAGINRVFTHAGLPAPGIKFSFFKRDLFDNTDDEIFTRGAKLNDNPNDWHWMSNKPPKKDDINTATGWVAINPANNHIWLAISGDRLATNGTSYIDFEFSQNKITRTGGPIPGGIGGFSTNGPHNGRTVGDITLTLEFTTGGSLATVKYLQWQPGNEAGSYDYFPLNPPAGTAFAAANDGPIDVPYGAFGDTKYSRLQWVEGAIDLTALIGGAGAPGECGTQPFESLFIKTKSSSSSTAELKDFIAPFSLNTCFDETPPVINCPPTIVLGCNPTIPGPSFVGGTASDNCTGTVIPVSADGPVQSNGCSRTMNRIWRATDACGNAASCIQQITWTEDHTGPVITTSNGNTSLGCNPSPGDIIGALGTASASDGCGGSPTLSTPTDGSVTSDGCSRSQTRSWTARDACGNTSTASRTVTWTSDNTPPVITTGGTTTTLGCNPTTGDINGALGTASATDGCGTPSLSAGSDGTVGSNGCTRTQTRTWTARDACGNTSTASRTVTWTSDNTPPVITTGGTTTTLGCNPTTGDINGALGTASATDGCGTPSLSAGSDGTVGSNGCTRTQTRTWTARDACGNTSTASRTVTWTSDNTPPVITTGGTTTTLGCNPTTGDINGALGTASATDGCGTPSLSAGSDGTVGSDGCTRTQTRTWTARDACGNTSTASRTVTWTSDNTPPVITTGGTTTTLGCNPTTGDINGALGTASATDGCGTPSLSAGSDGTVGSNGCTRTQTRTWTARDACGNTSTASRTVTWTSDNTPPVITTGGTTTTLGCNPTTGDINGALGTASATDGCGTPSLSAGSDGTVGSDGCTRTQTRTWTARDACGNTSTASRTVTWTSDNTPPVITTGGTTTTLGCNPTTGDINGALGTASATDGCGTPSLSAGSDGTVGSNGCTRTQTRTWTARDACGNTSTASRTVTWTSDNTPPVITTGGTTTTLGCNPTTGDINGALGTASATDGCGTPSLSAGSDGTVGSDGCTRTQTRTWTARDACGNTSTASRTVTWTSDNTPPVITTGGTTTTLGCNPTTGDINGALGTASATDGCGTPSLSAGSDGTIGSNGCTRTQTRTWTARDACGNTSTASRTVTWTSDNTPPVITTGGTTTTLGCNPTTGDINGALGTASATDGCGTPSLSAGSDGTVGSDGCTRTQTRTWTARDACGNTSTASRTVTWTSDNTPPVITTGGTTTTLGCNPTTGDINGALGTASATDGCGTPSLSAGSDGTVGSDGCTRTQTRTWTARDACGNTSTASRTVTWTSDNTPPVITTGGTTTTLGCNPTTGDINGALGTASATDGCGTPSLSAGSDGTVGSDGCTRTQTRTWTARDACGNTSTASRTVTWTSDNTPPVITTGGTTTTLGCNPTTGDINGALGTASATDGCGTPSLSAGSDGTVGSDGCTRTQTRTWTARDACGNTSTASRTVTWTSDNTPPVITTGGTTTTLGCNPTTGDINGALGTASATDGCGTPSLSAGSDGTVGSDGCTRTQTRTWTARDACGNTSTASRTVTWTSDNTPPVITTGGTTTTLGCNPTTGDINGALGTASATDGCGTPSLSAGSDGTVGSNGCTRTQTRTWTARDACGNTSTASRTVTWTSDNTPPVITTGGTTTTLGCNPTTGDINGALGTASATDGCGTPSLSAGSDGTVGSNGCTRTQTRTWTARDACGNTSTASRTVTWTSDNTPPVITTGGTTTTLGCNPTTGDINGALGTASATDGCGTPSLSAGSDGTVGSNGCTRTQTRTWTARDACGNTSTASRTVTWTSDNTPPVITTGGTTTTLGCNPTTGDINGALGTASATDGCGTPSLSAGSDGTVGSNGCTRTQTRTWTARDACGNTSTASRTVTWTSDNTPPVITTGGTTTTLGCNPTTGDINGALGTASATDGCGTPSLSAGSDGTVGSNGCTRTQTRTWTARDACGNTSTASRTVTWTSDNTPPVFTTTPANVDLDCLASIPAPVAPTASDACGTPTVTMTGSTDNPANCTTGFKRIVTRTWTATDACGNTATYTQTIRVKCCETVCTLTQGAYGNAGGNICLPNGTTVNQTQIMINALTAAPGNMKVFGRQDLSKYWVIRLSDITSGNIFNMLPGGGSSAVFGTDNVAGVPEYSNEPSWPVVPLQPSGSQTGKIRNQLFSQTLTLYFNTTITGSTLANVSLAAGSLAVIAPRNCGSSEPGGSGVPTQLVSSEISNYLATHGYAVTVAGLLQLANDALGGVNVSPLTLSQIEGAVDNINNAFDGCKILTGYNQASSGSGRVITSNSISSQPSLIVTAFPNPYQENFSLKINSPITGQAAISFYTMDGVKIGEMKRDVVEKKDVWVPYNVPAVYRTRIVYTVTVGSYNAKGIVLSPN